MAYSWLAKGSSNRDLIDQLKEYDLIESPSVEQAMRETDRGLYSKSQREAYMDCPHSIGHGATISAPHMHAKALDMLRDHLKEGNKVLDVGSGSGYLSACLARMVGKSGKVVGIDIIPELVDWSIQNMNRDDPNFIKSGRVQLKLGDGWEGDPQNGPYDAIHVGAAAESLPQKLVDQLKPGGRMVIPVGKHNQWFWLVDKDKAGKVTQEKLFGVQYVPLVKQS